MEPGAGDDWRPWAGERVSELRTAIVFLTRIPFAGGARLAAPAVARAGWAFPVAGAIVGVIGAIVYALAYRLGLTPWPAAALAVASTMAATGALHEDGLADTVDGFGGGATREEKLAIMRDARIGAYGVCALVLSILLRASAIASLAAPGAVAAALIAAHVAARAVLPAVMFFVPPARSDGLSFAAGQPPVAGAAIAALLGLLALIVCLGFGHAVVALVVLAVTAGLLALLSVRQIGGQTGDALGAVEQVGEIAVLLAAAG